MNTELKAVVLNANTADAYRNGHRDGRIDGMHLAHMLVAHMLDCPGAKKTDIVSQTPEYKIGYVEALVNAMTAIEAKLKDPDNPTQSHDHHHLQSETESQSHDQQSDAAATAGEPPSQS